MIWLKRNGTVIGHSAKKRIKVVGTYDNHSDAQVNKLKKNDKYKQLLRIQE